MLTKLITTLYFVSEVDSVLKQITDGLRGTSWQPLKERLGIVPEEPLDVDLGAFLLPEVVVAVEDDVGLRSRFDHSRHNHVFDLHANDGDEA